MSKSTEAGVQPYSGSDDSLHAEQPKKRWYSYAWDTFDKTPEERKFLFKLDAYFLTIACLGTLLRPKQTLNMSACSVFPQDTSSNTSIRAIFSMLSSLGCRLARMSVTTGRVFANLCQNRKEDLEMNGNQLNYVITTWTVGYLLGMIPSNILLTRVRPSIWLPSLQVEKFPHQNRWSHTDTV